VHRGRAGESPDMDVRAGPQRSRIVQRRARVARHIVTYQLLDLRTPDSKITAVTRCPIPDIDA